MNGGGTARAERVMTRCWRLAACTEVPGETTRLFLTPPMHEVHALVRGWMEEAGMTVRVDGVGNLRGSYAGSEVDAPLLLIASHLDTVPNAGAFDGMLGVLLGIAVVEELHGERMPFGIEVIGFSEEEGIRFGKPFLGSLALVGRMDAATLARTDKDGVTIAEAIQAFGLGELQPSAPADHNGFGYLEFHIEQGPLLESEGRALGVVEALAGQTRMQLVFSGQANHAGTTPMALRHDALAAAAHWIVEVEREAQCRAGLVATVGRIEAKPGAVNIIPGEVTVSLDVRHAKDEVRHTAVAAMLGHAEFAAKMRGLQVTAAKMNEQAAVPLHEGLVMRLIAAAERAGFTAGRMTSGAGHDAMIVAAQIPSVMLFLRTPGGISHHPSETVLVEDVEAALATAMEFVRSLRDEGAVGYRL